MGVKRFKAAVNIRSFGKRGMTRNRADRDGAGVGLRVNVLLSDLGEVRVEDSSGFRIDEQTRGHALAEKFESARRADNGLSGEDHHRIGLLRVVDDQKMGSPAGKEKTNDQQKNKESEKTHLMANVTTATLREFRLPS